MSRTASGLRAWVLQRITAIYLGLFTLYLLVLLLAGGHGDWRQWRDLFAQPLMSVATLLYVLAMLLHAWIGVRDVLIDYVRPLALRISLLALVGLGLVACGLWAAQALLLARLH